jgi:hypothetical protein
MASAKQTIRGRARAIADSKLTPNLAREAYEHGMNVSRYLESLDPSTAHTGRSGEVDAFNRVLRACGIRTRTNPEAGLPASTLEDVVRHKQARYLAVEIFARAYRSVAFGGAKYQRTPISSGMGVFGSFGNQFAYPATVRDTLLAPAIPLSEMIGVTTGIRTNVYRPFYLDDVSHANSRVSEMAEIPAVSIAQHEKTITLRKYGRRIDASYEALRHMPIDLLSFYVQRIAIAVETEKVDTVLGIIVAGDGTPNTAATAYNLTTLDAGTTANNITLIAWLAFKMKFLNPVKMTTVLGNDDMVLKLLTLDSGLTNFPLMAMGGFLGNQVSSLTPINDALMGGERVGWLASAPATKLVGFDRRLSIERIFEIGATIQESDKDVKSQIDSLVLSEVEGYSIIDPAANKVINVAA